MSKEEALTSISIDKNVDPVDVAVNNEKADRIISIDNSDAVEEKKKKSKKGNKKKNKDEELGPKVSYFKLYRFANSWDITCIILGTICAVACGVGQPLVAQLMGDVIQSLTGPVNPDTIKDQVAALRDIVIKFTIIGACMFVAAYGQMCFFTLSAENQTKRILRVSQLSSQC
ncbi:hypothetical protein K7432_016094 [Basidiobolus ranarum]|uniref:ABC transmembrane type-1 domain-containing protein n=1 Tax=Basidiobolus ranarum TaxID=34480 RepID=A0ABR2WFB7_9FUNG